MENKIKVTIVATGLDGDGSEIINELSSSSNEEVNIINNDDFYSSGPEISKSNNIEEAVPSVFFDGNEESFNSMDAGLGEDEYDVPSFLRRKK
jgi:cell division protein FtsZ